jgi:hypothetical protein
MGPRGRRGQATPRDTERHIARMRNAVARDLPSWAPATRPRGIRSREGNGRLWR